MVSYAQCDLALRAHYLKRGPTLDMEEVQRLLTHVISSRRSRDKVISSLKADWPLAVGDIKAYEGVNDRHKLSVKAADSPAYGIALHYEWLPSRH